jgi:hypothetical protein
MYIWVFQVVSSLQIFWQKCCTPFFLSSPMRATCLGYRILFDSNILVIFVQRRYKNDKWTVLEETLRKLDFLQFMRTRGARILPKFDSVTKTFFLLITVSQSKLICVRCSASCGELSWNRSTSVSALSGGQSKNSRHVLNSSFDNVSLSDHVLALWARRSETKSRHRALRERTDLRISSPSCRVFPSPTTGSENIQPFRPNIRQALSQLHLKQMQTFLQLIYSHFATSNA